MTPAAVHIKAVMCCCCFFVVATMVCKDRVFTLNEVLLSCDCPCFQSELPRAIALNFAESDLGCTSMIKFDYVTLTLHNARMTSQKPCQHNNKCDCSKTNGNK